GPEVPPATELLSKSPIRMINTVVRRSPTRDEEKEHADATTGDHHGDRLTGPRGRSTGGGVSRPCHRPRPRRTTRGDGTAGNAPLVRGIDRGLLRGARAAP